MKAAVVTEFDHAPRYADWDEPPEGEIVDVVAAALHPRVRSQATGSHYTSTEELPLVPGIDGVGRRSDGSLVYFVLPDTRLGSMAERTGIDPRRSIPLPPGADANRVAAAMNPAMSSWLALRKRATLRPGQSVLILGATGSAGQLAIQVARHLGAARVVAAGRDAGALGRLDAETVSIAGDPATAYARLADVAADVDVVVDYLWGEPAQLAIPAILGKRNDRSRPLDWVQVGAVTGADLSLRSEWLRGANIRIMGSGQGSVSTLDILDELVPLVDIVGTLALDVATRELRDVEATWSEPSASRIVFTP